MAVGGVVARLLGEGTVILVGDSFLFEILLHKLLERKGCVVAGQSDGFDVHHEIMFYGFNDCELLGNAKVTTKK